MISQNILDLASLPLPTDTKTIHWTGLFGSHLAFALAKLLAQSSVPILIVTEDAQTAEQLTQEIDFFRAEHAPAILHFPHWETLPYDQFSPHQNLVSERLETLYRAPQLTTGALITSIATLLHRLPPVQFVQGNSLILRVGDKLDIDTFRQNLQISGYQCVSQVAEHGEFAVRGALLDLFPTGSPYPIRIDLFDNDIESLRIFDPDTQRTIRKIPEIVLLPAREFPLTETAITQFRQSWRKQFTGNPTNSPMYQAISRATPNAGAEYYLPLFFETTATLLDYLPAQTLTVYVGQLEKTAQQFWAEIHTRYEQLRHDQQHPLLPPKQLFVPLEDWQAQWQNIKKIYIHTQPSSLGLSSSPSSPDLFGEARLLPNTFHYQVTPMPQIAIAQKTEQPLAQLRELITNFDGRILFCAESLGRRELILDLLKGIQIKPVACASWQAFNESTLAFGFCIAPLAAGAWLKTVIPRLDNLDILIITENELFGQQTIAQRRYRKRGPDFDSLVKNLNELRIGEAIVHLEHGIGRYQGLQTMTINNCTAEFLVLSYANDDKLYVPVASLHLISRYSGIDTEHAPLHKLGGKQWGEAKQKAADRARDVAAELLEVYAKRAARKGLIFDSPDTHYATFAASFPFEETPDQQQAIEQVLGDLHSERPMDRLICGDVGFGKTEVALRAAFLAVHNSRQVAFLVPTTLLAQQHYQTFRDRLADWPIRVELLSRFRTQKEEKQTLIDLANGKVDIVIGTHKLLQNDVQFHNLGLLIIDEEHRFGVRQKEKFKALRSEVHILTLTATPIPRTLNMAFARLRDLSLITTPPARRLATKTFVAEYQSQLVRDAILREIMRGGQVFYLYNDVATIEKTATQLREIVPEARITVAHGQMRERDLERVMADFYHKRFNVLVCSTIIETGIDIPSANTIVIERADRFGLAQLHQLRGRVGRSHHQAYAYLIVPNKENMTPDAKRRLDAIASLEDLGAGFALASHDLEIRGAGELLGDEQSGNIEAVGFTLYMELLERAVKSLKEGKQLSLEPVAHTEIDLQISVIIPEDYIPDVHTRLVLYKRIASAANQTELDDLQVEMIDRFGLLPEASKNLFTVSALKLQADQLGIRAIKGGPKGGFIEFIDKPNVDPKHLINVLKQQPGYQFASATKMRFQPTDDLPATRLTMLANLLQALTAPQNENHDTIIH